jgi:hypothetical protein
MSQKFLGGRNFSPTHNMAPTLGKRKRAIPEKTEKKKRNTEADSGDSFDLDAQEIFRRHFEAQFKPLQVVKKTPKPVEAEPENDSDEDSEWYGISDEEEMGVQVIEHTDAQARMATMSKDQLKAFMVSRRSSQITPLTQW